MSLGTDANEAPFTRVLLSSGHVAIVDSDDFSSPIDYQLPGGGIVSICVSRYRWADVTPHRKDRVTPAINSTSGGKRFVVKLHRLIARAKPGEIVDHKNFNTLDCRRENLRIVSGMQSTLWRRPLRGNSSPFKGVHWDRHSGKWRAQTSCNRKRLHIGVYETALAAALAYDAAAVRLFGEFAAPNFPERFRRIPQ